MRRSRRRPATRRPARPPLRPPWRQTTFGEVKNTASQKAAPARERPYHAPSAWISGLRSHDLRAGAASRKRQSPRLDHCFPRTASVSAEALRLLSWTTSTRLASGCRAIASSGESERDRAVDETLGTRPLREPAGLPCCLLPCGSSGRGRVAPILSRARAGSGQSRFGCAMPPRHQRLTDGFCRRLAGLAAATRGVRVQRRSGGRSSPKIGLEADDAAASRRDDLLSSEVRTGDPVVAAGPQPVLSRRFHRA